MLPKPSEDFGALRIDEGSEFVWIERHALGDYGGFLVGVQLA